jgi:diguanylate cyclase (GGDEF)-like protein
MASVLQVHLPLSADDAPARVREALAAARGAYYEEPADALTIATVAHEAGRTREDRPLRARAQALQCAIALHRGDLATALALVVSAQRDAGSRAGDDPAARAEIAAVRAQLCFFAGSYAEALGHADVAIGLAHATGERALEICVRRGTCMVYGNVGIKDLHSRITELLALTIAAGDPWEEAVSRNDLACYWHEQGDGPGAEAEIAHALATAARVHQRHDFLLGLIHTTRADIQLAAGRPGDALADARLATQLLTTVDEPNPYILGATIRAEIQARMMLGELDDAHAFGERALEWLGDRVPQTRSLILNTLATELRSAGRLEEAFDTLTRANELERQAFRELAELQASVERAALETEAARRESDALAARNRELSEQADRDYLTGLHNRRYLARELEAVGDRRLALPLSVAVFDLDAFKSINDRFGHGIGDQVLVRVAGLLCDALREDDIVVRNGGEEFLVVMPGTDERAGANACERIRLTIEHEPWHRVAPGLTVTTSVGVAFTAEAAEVGTLSALADERLYEAKRRGRNQVVGSTQDDTPQPSGPPHR